MLAWIVLELPLTLISAPLPPTCQLDVLPPFVVEERVVLSDFRTRIEEYVRLHRRLERALPPERLFADAEDMSEAVDALHLAITAARPNAQAGTIFTPAVAAIFTERLEWAIATLGPVPAKIAISMDLGYLGLPELQINGRFPAIRYARAWPVLVTALPGLPDELQYRFVGRDLVLVDVHADLVVDVLKEALPERHSGLTRDFAPARKTPQRPDDVDE